MKKKIFAVADCHNCFKDLIEALNKAGYDEENPEHLLITLGDMFDRNGNGGGSLAMYQYLKRLSDEGKAIVLRGNHTSFFERYLNGNTLSPFNYFNNGTDETYADFLLETNPFGTWCVFNDISYPTQGDFVKWLDYANDYIKTTYPELLDWLKERPYYFETPNYIFTHASIDTNCEDWHNPTKIYHNFTDWEACTWDDGSFWRVATAKLPKKIVIGHFHTRQLRRMYNIKTKGDIDTTLIREDDKIIALDGCTNLTHKVNVFIVEEEVDL
jgi:serine/threonine protein phosphatase 1